MGKSDKIMDKFNKKTRVNHDHYLSYYSYLSESTGFVTAALME